jgi:hypothetical protein
MQGDVVAHSLKTNGLLYSQKQQVNKHRSMLRNLRYKTDFPGTPQKTMPLFGPRCTSIDRVANRTWKLLASGVWKRNRSTMTTRRGHSTLCSSLGALQLSLMTSEKKAKK